MVRNWLRFFPQFRALESDLRLVREDHARLSNENLRLQDRLDAASSDRNRLWELMAKSIDEMKTAYQMHVNQSWQKMGGGIPYPDAPHLPPSAAPREPSHDPIGRRGRLLPSEAVQQQTDAFLRSYVNR